eukprot:1189098-Prorocentrum_minimum.AAC.2
MNSMAFVGVSTSGVRYLSRTHASPRPSLRVGGGLSAVPQPVQKRVPRSVVMQAFNPNDPMTWNSDEENEVPTMPPQEPEFLSQADLSNLLSAWPFALKYTKS